MTTVNREGHEAVSSRRHWGEGWDCRTHGGSGRGFNSADAWDKMTSNCEVKQSMPPEILRGRGGLAPTQFRTVEPGEEA